ncbi:MAG: FHA domain-containing protein [Oscillospiraceae bacterium]|nr:FHA domain-containing protein [Oscillospiraceae bacterium]
MKKEERHTDLDMTNNTVSMNNMIPYIECIKGEYEGYEFPVLSTGILIGRDINSCQIVCKNTPNISRYHCRVTYSNKTGYFVITDLNSKNGIWTENGVRIETGSKIVIGDQQIFKLCRDELIFQTKLKSMVI